MYDIDVCTCTPPRLPTGGAFKRAVTLVYDRKGSSVTGVPCINVYRKVVYDQISSPSTLRCRTKWRVSLDVHYMLVCVVL